MQQLEHDKAEAMSRMNKKNDRSVERCVGRERFFRVY